MVAVFVANRTKSVKSINSIRCTESETTFDMYAIE